MKSPQLIALKSAERFVIAELAVRENSYLPMPSAAEQRDISDAVEVKQIIQRAIVAGELEPDLRVEMLAALKRCLEIFGDGKALSRFDWGRSFLRAEDIRELNELPGALRDIIGRVEA